MSKRRVLPRLIDILMVCSHATKFEQMIAPKPGEIIWCTKCRKYKEVSDDN